MLTPYRDSKVRPCTIIICVQVFVTGRETVILVGLVSSVRRNACRRLIPPVIILQRARPNIANSGPNFFRAAARSLLIPSGCRGGPSGGSPSFQNRPRLGTPFSGRSKITCYTTGRQGWFPLGGVCFFTLPPRPAKNSKPSPLCRVQEAEGAL